MFGPDKIKKSLPVSAFINSICNNSTCHTTFWFTFSSASTRGKAIDRISEEPTNCIHFFLYWQTEEKKSTISSAAPD